MSIIPKLASSLSRKDEVPNQELAKQIVAEGDKRAIIELIDHLQTNKNKKIQSDCIKVLYEIGEVRPALIAPYYQVFVETLKSKNNRLVWGAMTALDTVASFKPKAVYDALSEILIAMESGSVITKDHGIGILIKLGGNSTYQKDAFFLLMEQLKICPPKQLPMYAERALAIINTHNKAEFSELLISRKPELEKDSQRKRIDKMLRKC